MAGNKGPRILVVANRLPFTPTRINDGEVMFNLQASAGGLVSGLGGVKEFDVKWIGWAGIDVRDKAEQEILTELLAKERCIPIFLSEEMVNQYYNGYSNSIVWPLFHYFGLPNEYGPEACKKFQSRCEYYKQANKMFADKVIECYKEGDLIWVQDYHLMYVPEYLKDHNGDMSIGWFLHTPFPNYEAIRAFSSSPELLRAILRADLVGLHTPEYVRHFISAGAQILGWEGTPEGVIDDQERFTRVADFPIGIDPGRFIKNVPSTQVQTKIESLAEVNKGKKIILGVDRFDIIKGIPEKLLAFEKLLQDHPELRYQVQLHQVVVPTRSDIPQYQKLKKRVYEISGRINAISNRVSWTPVKLMECNLTLVGLCAFYASADVALVTSLRDGMNLVSYEYVATQANTIPKRAYLSLVSLPELQTL